MLKDISRINSREQQESWSTPKKRRKKKDTENIITAKQGGDTLDLSYPARYLAFFKNVDFKHWSEGELLCFELKTIGTAFNMTLSGNIDTNTLRWKLSWMVESDKNNVKENDLQGILYHSFSSLFNNSGIKDIDFHLSEEESKNYLSTDSNESVGILKDLLTLIQTMLPLVHPQKKGVYSPEQVVNTGSSPPWPTCFRRNKVAGIQLQWVTIVP